MLRSPWISCWVAVSLASWMAACPPCASRAQDWTRFRGPNGSGISLATTVPTTWTDREFNWKSALPGEGHSSPVIWGDRVFVTSAEDDGQKRWVLCLAAADGRTLWQREFASQQHKKHQLNSFASPSPAVDDERVYCTWSSPEEYTVVALDRDGREAWRRSLGGYESQHSAGPSPVVYGDLLLVGNEQDGPSSLVALDRRTGQTRWQTPRTNEFVSYATPCVYRAAGSETDELIFLSGAHGVTSVDPADGRVNWELDVFDKRTVSSPLLADGLIFGSCGSGAGGNYVAAVRPGGRGREPELAWKIEKSAPYCPTGIVQGDRLFLWSEQGVATCVQAATGEVIWQKRVGGKFFGSPVWIDGRLFCLSADGEVVVLSAGDEFAELARVPLGELSHSTPAVSHGVLYLRTASHLISVGGPK